MRIILLLTFIALLVVGIWLVVTIVRNRRLRKLVEGTPFAFLSAKDRRAHAKELLARERDEYELKRQERLARIIWNQDDRDAEK